MYTFENWLFNFMYIYLSIWEFAHNRKKFMKPIKSSRIQILRWSSGCRMFVKEYFGAEHLWKGGEGSRIGRRRIWAAMQVLPLLWLTPLDIRIVPYWSKMAGPLTRSLHQPWKWAALGMAWSWMRRPELKEIFLWRSIWMAYHHVHHSTWITLIYR